MIHTEHEKDTNTSFLTVSACLSVRLPVCLDGHFHVFLLKVETAESGWRHVKYRLVAERSHVRQPDVTHCSAGSSRLKHMKLQ